ncbi:MAG TPA: CHAT domain-containing protein [Syntrophales bacterium]|nr:CHAT domain-containing protein [Syntrophales bacterium]
MTTTLFCMLALEGCSQQTLRSVSDPGIPALPIPIMPYAPLTELVPEKTETPLMEATLANGKGGSRNAVLAMRGGRALVIVERKTDEELLESLPSAALKRDFLNFYVPAPPFRVPQIFHKHTYNFLEPPEFVKATSNYLAGRAEEALAQCDLILADSKKNPALLWQTSHLRVNVLLMMGMPDLAEAETARTEKFERLAMGKRANQSSRALRAEVRYWAGDIEGAIEDATAVIISLGTWRFPTRYSMPPNDIDQLERLSTAQARANIVLGLSLIAKGKPKLALPWLELANQTMNNLMFVGLHPLYGLYWRIPDEIFQERGMSLVALGTALISLDQEPERVTGIFEHARSFFEKLHFRVGPVLIDSFKAHAMASSGQFEKAAQQAFTGTQGAEKLGLLDYVWRLEAVRGHAFLELGRVDEAEQALRHAQAVVDLLAGTMATDDDKVRFGVGKEGITRDLIQIDLKKHDMARLFEDLERGRARSFVQLLSSRAVHSGKYEPVVARIRNMDHEIQLERQKKNALSSQEKLDFGREQKLLEERTALVAQLRKDNPDLADVFAVSAVSLDMVRKSLNRNTLLVYALPEQEKSPLKLLFVSPDNASVLPLSINGSQLKELIDKFNSTIGSGNAQSQLVALNSISTALELSTWPKADAIYFVPSGYSYFIPWGALDVPYPVAVEPNGGWVTRAAHAPAPQVHAAIIGDPEFGGMLPQLPGARAEAQLLAGLYKSSALIGETATESALRREVGESIDVLHFATHALFDTVYPLQSALVLSDGTKATPLTAGTLFAKPLKSRLVVLSACETGMGKIVSGDELLGLARSFYLGGASSILSSLWPVDDEATRMFMEIFHKQSRDGNLGRAWLTARDELRAKGFPPSSYGAFVLGGSFGKLSVPLVMNFNMNK